MNTQNWLTLMEYSALYRVSLSTLRRRIKSGDIEFKLIEGKYLIKNGPFSSATQTAPAAIAPPTLVSAQVPAKVIVEDKPVPSKVPSPVTAPVGDDQFWRATQGLLSEIKKAYSLILQEKEEQILQLKDEVADLKTLVRVLEDDNLRLKSSAPSQDFDLGLEL